MKIHTRPTLGLLLALGLLVAPWSVAHGASMQVVDPCLCITNIGAECTGDLSDVGHYDPTLPDPPPAAPVDEPPAHDFAADLQGLFRAGQEGEFDRLSLTADANSTGNDTDWSLALRRTSQAITPDQAEAASACEESLPITPDEATGTAPMLHARLRALAEDVTFSIAALLDGR